MDKEIKAQLDRIEQYAMIAAKTMLNIKEAAFVLGMTTDGVRLKCKRHDIPFYKPNQNRLYFNKAELECWMSQNRAKTSREIEMEAEAYLSTH